MKQEQRESYTEILTILKYMEDEYREKVPKKLIEFFERNCAKDYKFDIDLSIPLEEQELKAKTVSLLAMLDLNYWCNNEDEKKELIKLYSENENRYQEWLKEKYNPDNILKKTNQENKIIEESTTKEISLVEYKESLYKRLLNTIKKFLYKLTKQ